MEQMRVFGVHAPRLIAACRFGAELLMVAVLGVLMARLFWLVVAPSGAVSQIQPAPRYATPSAFRGPVQDASILLRYDPFSTVPGTNEIAIDAPPTRLNLILKGVRAASEPSASSAFIIAAENQGDAFRVGDAVMDGVTISRILSDRVILSKNGDLESLMLEGRGETLSVIFRPGEVSEPRTQGTDGLVVSANPSSLISSLQLTPERVDGNLTGYRLTARDDGAVMQASGLMPGDILIEVDGDGIGDFVPSDLMDRMTGGAPLSIAVKRDAEIVRLQIKFENGSGK